MDEKRYSIDVVAADQQQIDLLECLVRIDRGEALDQRAAALRGRMIEGGLVEDMGGSLRLTPAGIERCRSLQYRMASDREVVKAASDRESAP